MAKGRTGGEHARRLSTEFGESLNNVCSRCTPYGNAMRIALLRGRSFSTALISHSKCSVKKCAGSLPPFLGTLSLENRSRPEMQQAGAARPAKAIRFCASFLESAAIRIALPQMTSPQVVSREVVRSTTVNLGCQPSVATPMAPSVAPIIAQRSATQRS
jgi:hypothetical protein